MASNFTLPYQLFLSFALGTGARPAIEPFAQSITNEAWATHAVLPPDAVLLAQGVAQGQVAKADAYSWAKEQGFDTAQMDAMVNIANVGMPLGTAFEAWRRGTINDGDFQTQLHRLGIEPQWWAGIEKLHDVLLSSAELAMAQQQGFVDQARSNSEAALQGVTNERQQIRFELSGLPPGVETALAMLRRGIIDQATFAQIVREGHTKTKYTDVLTQMERQLLSPATAVRARLKGHIDDAEMHSRGAQWGYSAADMDLWELSEGRPATAHEIHIGYARGATVPGAANELDAIATAVKQSDIRPEYTDVIQAGRFSYPSPFVLRSLAQSGDLGDTAAVEQVLLEIGWKPSFAQEVARAWTGGSGTTADPHVTKAQNQLWTATHASYVKDRTDDATAKSKLAAIGVSAAAIDQVVTLWQEERELVRAGLSAAQIKKAYGEATFTQPEAVARLVELGWSAADAAVYLGE